MKVGGFTVLADRGGKADFGGVLEKLEGGRLSGEVVLEHGTRSATSVTVEIFVHGISICRNEVAVVQGTSTTPFQFTLTTFPEVDLPCVLQGRVVETDLPLRSKIEINTLEDLWACFMPFTAKIEKISHTWLVVRTTCAADRKAEFELRDWGRPIAVSELDPTRDSHAGIHLIRMPEDLLDGGDHRLTIVHRESGLPISKRPISLRLDLRETAGPTLQELSTRVERLESDVKARFADAFNALALPLYRHIDAVTLNQRGNFEREIAAMRRLLGIHDDTPGDRSPASEATLGFEQSVAGYGIHAVQITNTGKAYRFVAPTCGFLLPGLASRPSVLKIQGIRRMHPNSLAGITVYLNGTALDADVYRSPTSESWNVSARIAEELLREDRNLIELHMPNGAPDRGEDPRTANMAVGIMFARIEPAPPETPERTPEAGNGPAPT